MIFGLDIKRRYVFGYVTEDERYLIINASNSTSGNELYIKDLNDTNSRLKCVINNFENDHSVIHSKGDTLFIATNLNAPNKKVIYLDFKKPEPQHWNDFIAETEHVLQFPQGPAISLQNILSMPFQKFFSMTIRENS